MSEYDPHNPQRPSDEDLIRRGIDQARVQERPIDHAKARVIAAKLHGGQTSALCALATSGAIVEGLEYELTALWFSPDVGPAIEPWVEALTDYIAARQDRQPVARWSDLWPSGADV